MRRQFHLALNCSLWWIYLRVFNIFRAENEIYFLSKTNCYTHVHYCTDVNIARAHCLEFTKCPCLKLHIILSLKVVPTQELQLAEWFRYLNIRSARMDLWSILAWSLTRLSRLSLLLATEDCLDLTETPEPDTTLALSLSPAPNTTALSRQPSSRSLSSLKWSAKAQNVFRDQDLVSRSWSKSPIFRASWIGSIPFCKIQWLRSMKNSRSLKNDFPTSRMWRGQTWRICSRNWKIFRLVLRDLLVTAVQIRGKNL